MSLQIDRGLFQLDFIDHHAVLGLPIEVDPKIIRKRYLKVARTLHPDSLRGASDEDKIQATEILSKLVNPAYEKLSQEKELAEYVLLLKLKGQQAARQPSLSESLCEPAQQLAKAKELDKAYQDAVQAISDQQYSVLGEILDKIGQISELNLVYLTRKHGSGSKNAARSTPQPAAAPANPSPSQPAQSRTVAGTSTPPPPRPKTAPGDQYYRRAEGYIKANNPSKAILELRDALKLEPDSARCHALLGMIYLGEKQTTMARIHFDKALEVDPKNEEALRGKQQLEKGSGKAAGQKAGAKKSGKSDKSDGKSGGLFGLFGGRKK